ncbi:uncharacterized protein LOC142768261 [Rhipicephalus microplus]|uniref:uncharacterized protein LOC142768261 n=1 Tax=Rhipicephalus microplus TaxID=6941 RepID=UPI003F6CF34C
MSVVIAAALVLVVVLFSLGWLTGSPAVLFHHSSMRGFTLTSILKQSCISDDCKKAVAILNASIDATANPCEDMYQYTCGEWHALDDKGRPMTYQEYVNYIYVTAIHANITGGATTGALCHSVQPRAKMGCIYSSCVAFYTTRSSSLQDLLAAAKINPKEWMSIKDNVLLFNLLVSTVLNTHLTSVLNITVRDPKTAIIEIGMCISCSSSEADFLQFLLDEAVAIKVVDSKTVQRLHADFVRLDGALKKVRPALPGAPVMEAQESMLGTVDRLTWQQALLASKAGFKVKVDELELLSSNSDGVGKFVEMLYKAPVELASLYELLATVAPFAALEHYEAKRRESTEPFTAWSKCVNNMAFLFTVPFDTAVASWLGTEKAAVYFNNMWSSVRLAGTNALHLGTDLDISRDDLMAASLGDQEVSGLNDPAFDEKYDEDFLANLVRYQRRGRRIFRNSDYWSDVFHYYLFMPTNYFIPDYYYAGATEETLNSGTLGALTAIMLFGMGLPDVGSQPTNYAECLAEYSKKTLSLEVEPGDWFNMTRARWAVEVSLAATHMEDDTHHQKEVDALHYLRYARTYCGKNGTEIAPLHFALRTSANFDRVFDCAYSYPPMKC